MWLDLVSGLLSLFFFFLMYITWNNDYWLKQSIPYVEPEFLFGNIRDVVLMRRTVGQVYQDIYKKLKGKPLGGFFKLSQPVLMVLDPKLVGQVLVDKFDCFRDNDVQVRSDIEPILRMNPFLARGHRWKPIRDMMEASLKESRLQEMVSHITSVCKDMVAHISSNVDHPINVEEMSGRLLTDVMASCSFGKETHSFSGEPEFRRMTKKLFNAGFKSSLALLFAFHAPFMNTLLKLRIVSRRLATFFTEVVTDICKQRVSSQAARQDFLQGLIDINKESQLFGEGQVYKFEEIAGHCLAFLVDGYYPTAESLAFCLYELAVHPDVQSMARQEVLSISSNLSLLTYNEINSKMPYLDNVIKESGRVHPAIEAVTRLCSQDTVLSVDGLEYKLAKGTPVTLPIYALHMDPDHFPQPDAFRPDRFDRQPKPFSYLPYSAGPRACPGLKFSQMVLKLALASILSHYIMAPRDNSPIKLDPRYSFLRTPTGGIWIKFKPL